MFRLNKYLTKLLIFSLCLSTVPVILLGSIFYNRATNSIQEKVNEGNVHILELTRLRVEQVLQTVERSLERLADSSSVVESLDTYITPTKFQLFGELTQAMYRVQTFDVGVQDVHLINLQKGWIINNSGFYSFDEINYKERFNQYVNMTESKFWTSEQSGLTKDNRSSSNRVISLVKKIPANSDHPSAMLIAEISSRELSNLISKNNSLGEVIIFDRTNHILAMQNENFSGQNSDIQSLYDQLSGSKLLPGNLVTSLNGNEVGIVHQQSTYNQWGYLSIIPLEEIYKESRKTGWIVLISCLLLLLLSILISLLVSRKLYTPIRRLQESFKMPSGSIHASGDELPDKQDNEFDMINKSISHMQTLHNQMSQQINGQVKQLQELFVLKLLQGELKPSEIKEKLPILMSAPPYQLDWLVVFALQIDTLEGSRFKERDRELLLFAINNMINDIIPYKQRLLPITIHKHQVTIVYTNHHSAEQFKDFTYAMVEKIKLEIGRYLGIPISIGISRPYKDIKDAPHAYDESLKALKNRPFTGQNTILYYDLQQTGKIELGHFPEETEKALIQAIKYADADNIDVLLDRFLDEIAHYCTTYSEYQVSLVRFFVDVTRLIQDSGAAFHSVFENDKPSFEELLELKTKSEIQAWFQHQMIQPLLPLFEERRSTKFQNISREIIRMVQEEYDTDLTLEICASRLNYHSSYISRVLKNELGVNFSEYLSQYRLNVAKELLEEGSMKISAIAEKLRYHNPQNFIRYFRKMVGITPGKYREMYANEADSHAE
ncbi:helix-turn-helix domain-containing protein [Paenibacillus radicis (ex Xue et al. 2023)]|uniref:Helix-turn-helix domain-containing protein n=1 Tax=Paenibacillus radicis (ex Xue et al. 2023) TaxID=2972489 RepID=A0ABT1YMR5_9BACL|nr:helix-turn-helix domain-containing protein [Paenibacillus radicis (ex Xue et al. 2023)]MCR8633285.1 helix-turn-helix domain-containing protein [Paenibacillus radicis (ex Xue et al. 2023)]